MSTLTTLILLMGLPASGKTMYGKKLTGIHVNMDQIRKGATGSHQIQGNFNDLVHHLTQRSVHFYLSQGKTVIVDAMFLKASERKLYITMAKKLDATVELYWFDPSIEEIKKRLLLRGNEQGTLTLNKLSQSLEFPNKEEGIDVIHYIDEEI